MLCENKWSVCLCGLFVLSSVLALYHYQSCFDHYHRCASAESSTVEQFIASKCLMVFPTYESPKVSLIILTHNGASNTFKLLRSILDQNITVPYEVVISDDVSTERPTLSLLDRLQNVKVFKNEGVNFYYAKGNNYAVQHLASNTSNFVWLLNNDIQLLPGCFQALYQEITSSSTIGAVGGKLLDTNGLLQEAGSIIFRDGSALGYGRGDDPSKPEYNYHRRVDFISGACLMVRKEAYFAVGGISEIYQMYYEDVDFQMQLWYAKELQVIYQPKAEAYHVEHGSSSVESAVSQMEVSREKFLTQWSSLLEKKNFPLHQVYCARERAEGLRILFVDQCVADSESGSGFGRVAEVFKAIRSLGHSLTVYPFLDQRSANVMNDLRQMGIEIYSNDSIYWFPESMEIDLRQQMLQEFLRPRANSFDMVILSRPTLYSLTYPIFKKLLPHAHLIYDAEGVWFLRDELLQNLTGVPMDEPHQNLRTMELELYSKFDEFWFVSRQDQQVVQSRLPDRELKATIVTHALEVLETKQTWSERNGIGFLGAFSFHHLLQR